MNKKYASALVVAIVAVSFAVFVAANNASDHANTKVVKGAPTSQKTDTATAQPTQKDITTVATNPIETATTNAVSAKSTNNYSENRNNEPADHESSRGGRGSSESSKKNNDVVLAIVTKPVETPRVPVVEAANPAPQPVAPAPVVTPTPVLVTPSPTPATLPVTGNLVANPSAEDSTNNLPASWTYGGFGTNAAASTYATTGHNATAHSLQVSVSSYTDGDAKWLSAPIAVTAGQTYRVSDFYKSVGNSQVDVAYISGTTTTYAWLGDAAASADWAAFTSQFTVPAGVTSVIIFHSLTSVGSLSTDDYALTTGATTAPTPSPVPTPVPAPGAGFSGGRVSLTFDDGLESTATNGFPLLQKYGFASTQYWISDTLKNNDNYGTDYMTLAQAQAFLSSMPGTEVAGHTMHHCSLVSATTTDDAVNCLTNLNASEQAAQNTIELKQGKADLQALFPTAAITDFASPYGSYNATSIAEIKDPAIGNFASHRSTDAGYNSFGAFDPYNIMVQNVEATTTVAQFKSWVDTAISTNTWLVLVYHDVDNGTPGQYGVTTADLDAHLAYIKTKGVKVETVAQALAGN